MSFHALQSPRFNNTLAGVTPPPPTPPTPTNLSASVTGSTVTVTWNASSGAASYNLYRGPSGAPTLITNTTSTTFSETRADGIWSYSVSAVNAGGESALYSPWYNVNVDTTPPSVPAAPSLTVSSYNVTAIWAAPSGEVPSFYKLYRDGAQVAFRAALNYTDTVPADGTYVYTVSAGDAAGNWSAQSPGASITLDYSPPSVPTLTATAMGRSVTLTFTSSVDAVLFAIMRDGNALASTATSPYNDVVPADGTFSYTVAAKDAAGNWSAYSTAKQITADTTPPPAPVISVEPGASSAIITWMTCGDAVSYDIQRNGSVSGWTAGLTYTDSALADGNYTYAVRSKDSAGNYSAWSTTVTVPVDIYTRLTRPALFRVPLTSADPTKPATTLGREPLAETRKLG